MRGDAAWRGAAERYPGTRGRSAAAARYFRSASAYDGEEGARRGKGRTTLEERKAVT